MKPRIGLSTNYRTNPDNTESLYLDAPYFDAIAQLGAIPIPIVPTEDVVLLEALLSTLDALVLTGGLDLDASLWGQPLHRAAQLLHPRRQRFELLLYQQAAKHRLPILGICLGAQLINVAHGGALHQHLPADENVLDHGTGHSGTTEHPVTLDPESRLAHWLLAECINVPSAHHQGINRLGQGLLAAAVAPDGIVEAIERPGYPFLLAVQWHPERTPYDPVSRTIFDRFLMAAASRAPQHA